MQVKVVNIRLFTHVNIAFESVLRISKKSSFKTEICCKVHKTIYCNESGYSIINIAGNKCSYLQELECVCFYSKLNAEITHRKCYENFTLKNSYQCKQNDVKSKFCSPQNIWCLYQVKSH